MTHISPKAESLIYDFLQVSSLVYILFTAPVLASSAALVSVQVLAFLIIAGAVWEMRRTRFYRVPDIGDQNELVKSGIYRFVRNPMYLSQLLFTGALVIENFSLIRLAVYLIFLSNFIYKIRYEENLLESHFPDYQDYKKKSFRLIPFIY